MSEYVLQNMASDNGKRIAKNTLFLYFRMLLLMCISLYTSRVVLNVLGVEDFGIYNVVGGFVSMFNVLSAGLSTTTQRFLNFDLGRFDMVELQRTFSSCVQIFIFISLVIILLSEMGGIWFMETKMTIPADRLYAAKWVFHLSLLTLVINLISVPYNALIIAHERMKAFAYISIFEAVAKLIIVYAIYISHFDKLIFYAVLMCVAQLIVRYIYTSYCKRNFPESKLLYSINFTKIKSLYSFAGWAMFGGLASIGFTQGLNMLLNVFFGPVVNAARGIAVQVQHAINQFAMNFQMAVNPGIIKAYASNDFKYMNKMVYASSKYSFILLFALSLPLMLETDYVLQLWLKKVPEQSSIFFRLIICTTIIDAMANPIMRVADATGRIKTYQSIIGTLLLTIVPIAYIVLKLGFPSYSVFIVHIIICVIAFVVRLFIIKRMVSFSVTNYVREVILPVAKIVFIVPFLPILTVYSISEGFLRLTMVTTISLFMVISVSYAFALSKPEQNFVRDKIRKLWLR